MYSFTDRLETVAGFGSFDTELLDARSRVGHGLDALGIEGRITVGHVEEFIRYVFNYCNTHTTQVRRQLRTEQHTNRMRQYSHASEDETKAEANLSTDGQEKKQYQIQTGVCKHTGSINTRTTA